MVDHVTVNALLAHEATNNSQTKKVLRMVKNERMGGYVPSWEVEPTTPKDTVEQTLALAQNGQNAANAPSFEAALAYQQTQDNALHTAQNDDEDFGFGDLFDMVNPLHHIPLVGHAYRALTDDDIKPIGQIIGGAIYGGPVGAGVGMANVILEEETGKDMGALAYAMAFEGEEPTFKPVHNQNNPQEVLEHAVQVAEHTVRDDLPASLLAFTPQTIENGFRIEKISAASGRTAEQVTKHIKHDLDDIAQARQTDIQQKLETIAYEPVTDLKLATISDLY